MLHAIFFWPCTTGVVARQMAQMPTTSPNLYEYLQDIYLYIPVLSKRFIPPTHLHEYGNPFPFPAGNANTSYEINYWGKQITTANLYKLLYSLTATAKNKMNSKNDNLIYRNNLIILIREVQIGYFIIN